MRVQQIVLWYFNQKYECYTYKTLVPCIKSTGIAEAPKFSLSLIQEDALKRYIKSSPIFGTKFIIIVNEEKVEEEQLLI